MSRFKLQFSPHIKETYTIENNNIQEVIKVLSNYWNEDFIKYISKRCNHSLSISDVISFKSVTEDYSFGSINDGIDNHFFEIIKLEE